MVQELMSGSIAPVARLDGKPDVGKSILPGVEGAGISGSGSCDAVWSIKFNRDGKYLASGGKDTLVRVWILCDRSADVDTKETSAIGPSAARKLFDSTPFREYRGHASDILDLSWSKVRRGLFTLSPE